jgi:hypothetical protein
MAINFLPILLVGAAAAVVVSSGKKKKPAPSGGLPARKPGDTCPPIVTVGLDVMKQVADAGKALHGSNADPAPEANYWMENALPSTCSRSSLSSKFNFEIPISLNGPVANIHVSMPELYLIIFSKMADDRVKSGQITEAEAKSLFIRELDWYKKVTGKSVTIESLNAKLEKAVQDAIAKAS